MLSIVKDLPNASEVSDNSCSCHISLWVSLSLIAERALFGNRFRSTAITLRHTSLKLYLFQYLLRFKYYGRFKLFEKEVTWWNHAGNENRMKRRMFEMRNIPQLFLIDWPRMKWRYCYYCILYFSEQLSSFCKSSREWINPFCFSFKDYLCFSTDFMNIIWRQETIWSKAPLNFLSAIAQLIFSEPVLVESIVSS